jgi:hypothetical protein
MLKQIALMQIALGSQIGSVRGLWRLIHAKIARSHADFDLCLPAPALAGYAKQARAAIRSSGLFLIMGIHRAGRFAQIAPAIVIALAIAMIDHLLWQPAVHVQKGKAMSQMIAPVDVNYPIAFAAEPSGNLTGSARAAAHAIGKKSGLRIIVQAAAKCLGIKIIHAFRVTRHAGEIQA